LLPNNDLITRVPPAAISTEEVGVASDANTPDPIAATAEVAAATPTTAATPTIADTPTPAPSPTLAAPPVYTYNVIASYPHDPNAFTQGLDIDDENLYEGTGLWGQSSLRLVNLETGDVLLEESLSAEYFGEGITILGDRIYQITWQENTGFVYDQNSFELLQTFSYPTEGWGITHDGTRLIVSDGTATIYFWDPETLAEIGRISVFDNEGPVIQLNELEFINGEIWANVWLTDRIARISPETGQVLGWIDLTGLLDTSNLTEPVDVLNGIAYDESNGRLFVTGKLWPALYEIEVVPAQ
jgi:glutamine cyclotransferase